MGTSGTHTLLSPLKLPVTGSDLFINFSQAAWLFPFLFHPLSGQLAEFQLAHPGGFFFSTQINYLKASLAHSYLFTNDTKNPSKGPRLSWHHMVVPPGLPQIFCNILFLPFNSLIRWGKRRAHPCNRPVLPPPSPLPRMGSGLATPPPGRGAVWPQTTVTHLQSNMRNSTATIWIHFSASQRSQMHP